MARYIIELNETAIASRGRIDHAWIKLWEVVWNRMYALEDSKPGTFPQGPYNYLRNHTDLSYHNVVNKQWRKDKTLPYNLQINDNDVITLRKLK